MSRFINIEQQILEIEKRKRLEKERLEEERLEEERLEEEIKRLEKERLEEDIERRKQKFITDNQIDYYLEQNSTVLISHGGVGSEYLTELLKIKYPSINIKRNPFNNTTHSFTNAFVHYPYPPITNKIKTCVYLYGDIYNSILSQIERHPVNSSKLCNDMSYHHISNIKQLIKINSKDPFNIYKQIDNFMNQNIQYPIILLKYGFSNKLLPVLVRLTNNVIYITINFY